MLSDRFILSQILDLIYRETLSRLASRFHAESRVRHFGVHQQLICMVFAQLTWRDGLRDILECLNAKPEALYHLGFRTPVAKSTLADANERRDSKLWEALALRLIPKARSLYTGEDLGLDLEHTIYALDSTPIDLSLTMFPWPTFRSTKSGLVAILHKELKLPGSLHRTLQILSVHPFEKIALHELLMKSEFRNPDVGYFNQMELFDL
jgi:hypothetical protein